MNVETQIEHLMAAYGCATRTQLAERFGIGRRAVSEWKRAGRLPARVRCQVWQDHHEGRLNLPDEFFNGNAREASRG